MKKLIVGLLTLFSSFAFAATETQILTYPTAIEFVYDSDRDTSAGKNRTVVVDGAQGNGKAEGGDTGLLIVRGGVYAPNMPGSPFVNMNFAEGDEGADRAVAATMAAASGTAQALNYYYTSGGAVIAYAALGAGQTITSPDMTTTGLDISLDQTDDEGAEYVLGVGSASGRPFVVGTDPAFYTCAEISITDVSGTDDLRFGFRSVEQFRANFDDYLNAATIGTNATDIQTETIDDNGATTTTDIGDVADGASPEFCVFVSAAGVVTYTVDAAADSDAVAFTLDDGEIVIPMLYFLHAADVAGAVEILSWETGYTALKPIGD